MDERRIPDVHEPERILMRSKPVYRVTVPKPGTDALKEFADAVTSDDLIGTVQLELAFTTTDGTSKWFRHGLDWTPRGAWVVGTNVDLGGAPYVLPMFGPAAKDGQIGIKIPSAANVTVRVRVY